MSATAASNLRLSPAFPAAERSRPPPTPLDDRLRQLLAGLPDPARLLRRRRLARVVRTTARHEAWAREAALDPAAHCDTLAARLRSDGMTQAAVGPAFALVRALGERLLGVRAYDVQLLGAYAMLRGYLAEMATGEGKTLTAAMTAGVAALAGWPVHVVTVNDYLARRDADQLGPLYAALGLSSGLIQHGMSTDARRAAYACDIVYTSNKELTFDYLRDQILRRDAPTSLHLRLDRLAGQQSRVGRLVMRGLHFAIVDEADSVLIDEARTPLIISETGQGEAEGETAQTALLLADQLVADADYTIDPETRWVDLTPQYVPSPLLVDNYLYLISGNDGMVSCFDTKNGQPLFERERIEALRGVYASPVSAVDRVYVLGREGACVVLRKGGMPEVLAVNRVADARSDASIALVEKQLFLRTGHSLYCISQEP